MVPHSKLIAVGLAWYRPENFAEVRAMMTDSDVLPASHQELMNRVHKLERHFRRSGIAIVRVYLDTDDFPAFCRANGLDLDAEGRLAYVNAVAKKMLSADAGGNA